MGTLNVIIHVKYQVKSKDKVEHKQLYKWVVMLESLAMLSVQTKQFTLSQKDVQKVDIEHNQDILFNVLSSHVDVQSQALHLTCKINHILALTIEDEHINPLLTQLKEKYEFLDLAL